MVTITIAGSWVFSEDHVIFVTAKGDQLDMTAMYGDPDCRKLVLAIMGAGLKQLDDAMSGEPASTESPVESYDSLVEQSTDVLSQMQKTLDQTREEAERQIAENAKRVMSGGRQSHVPDQS